MKTSDAKLIFERCQGVIFDIDGTLLDSNDAHAHSFVEAFRELGEEVSYAKVRPLIGMGADKLIPLALGRNVADEFHEKIGEVKKRTFFEKYLPILKPFTQVRELLQDLKARGLRLAIATSAEKDELSKLLRQAGVESFFDEKASSGDAEASKPDPDIVQAAIDRLRISPERLVMIGDTPYDVEAASRAGISIIAFRCGGWTDDKLPGATLICDDAADLRRQSS